MPNMNDLNPRRYEEQNDETISVICPNLVAATSKPLDIGSHIVDNEAPKTLGTGGGVMGNPVDVALKSETKNEVKTEINQAQWPQTSDTPLDLTLKRPVSKSETKNEVKTEINQAQQPQIFDAPLDFTQKRSVSPAYSYNTYEEPRDIDLDDEAFAVPEPPASIGGGPNSLQKKIQEWMRYQRTIPTLLNVLLKLILPRQRN